MAESTDKIANLEFELKQAQDKLSSFEVEKSNFAAIDNQRQLTIQNMEVQERFRFGFWVQGFLNFKLSLAWSAVNHPSHSRPNFVRTHPVPLWNIHASMDEFRKQKKSYQNWN